MRSESIGGAKYFVTFIDDHRRYCEVGFIKRKDQVFSEFLKYKNMAEIQTGKRIKFIYPDNGTEYYNEFDKYLQDWGIRRKLTGPNTPISAKRRCGAEESNTFRYGEVHAYTSQPEPIVLD